MSAARPRVLYLVYWGALEPLGRTLVVPAVCRLAAAGVDMTLVTFDKPTDWRESEVAELRDVLARAGVSWLPLRYHKRPKLPATALDLATGVVRGWRARPFDVVHARSFAGGLMGLVLAPLAGAKLVYHNEGFYPDEQVDGGVWRSGSLAHRTALALERRLYESADGIIAMSRRSREVIGKLERVTERATPIVVVPSCADLGRFSRTRPVSVTPGSPLRLLYVGSVGARYRLDWIARFAAAAAKRPGGATLRVCTREEPARVAPALEAAGLRPDAFSIASVAHEEIPNEVARHDVGLFFLMTATSGFACSPTKIGEYWAGGIPVVASAGTGDVDEIVRRERTGVIVEGESDAAFAAALERVAALRAEPDLAERCRAAAARHYSLDAGCARQVELYRQILAGRERVAETAAVTS